MMMAGAVGDDAEVASDVAGVEGFVVNPMRRSQGPSVSGAAMPLIENAWGAVGPGEGFGAVAVVGDGGGADDLPGGQVDDATLVPVVSVIWA